MSGIAPIVGIAGSIFNFVGGIAAANAQKRQAEEYAKQRETQAKLEKADRYGQAQFLRRQADDLVSRVRTVNAASGTRGGAPIAMEDIYRYSGDREGMLRASGDAALNAGLYDAWSAREQGRANFLGAVIGGVGDLAGGLAGIAGKYGSYGGGANDRRWWVGPQGSVTQGYLMNPYQRFS